uniref:Selenoprotein S n=1 Tax=Scophthalmus maximus TaxID=52904 RepID=A0A8D3E0G8_SCOMX
GEVRTLRRETELVNVDFFFWKTGELLSQYGWPLLLVSVLGYLLIQYLSKWISRQSSNSSAPQTPQVARRQEALEAARRKMQEELDAKAVIFKEKQKQQEEEKRRQKVELWESMKEGKSYKRTAKSPQTTEEASSSSTTVLKAKTDKKPLRSAGMYMTAVTSVHAEAISVLLSVSLICSFSFCCSAQMEIGQFVNNFILATVCLKKPGNLCSAINHGKMQCT